MVAGRYEGTGEIPDSIVPFVGVRAWKVERNLREEQRLFSLYKPGISWPLNRRLEARCVQPSSIFSGGWGNFVKAFTDPVKELPDHVPPFADCTCGIYAMNSNLTPEEITPWQQAHITGLVLIWGKVLEGDRGWRAQYARIAALVVDSTDAARVQLIEQMATLYRVKMVEDLDAELERQRKLQLGGQS